ncbi:hypothetical protein DFH08DRAFT_800102 [Mycena albidolilacea]|uniref:Uncharacterized protein n=1 Tax=Mycena albidolilacea TaxID=1033008 RepID=A0AAD7AJ61_9AGAR|nr:hypothetical protein DFH08DRAFT_1030751 [Mycena albidolilacea]KAJ7360658.1 hypothetical protein DFH08DRAFT_800102 [Mycena albidolilacea]
MAQGMGLGSTSLFHLLTPWGARSTASSFSTRTSASDLSGLGMQDEDSASGSCASPSSPFSGNRDFGSPTTGMSMDWHMGSASPDPLVSKVEMLSTELGNVKASLSPLDSKLDQLLELLRNPCNPKHAAWIHDACVAFHQQPRIAPGSPQLAELKTLRPPVPPPNSAPVPPLNPAPTLPPISAPAPTPLAPPASAPNPAPAPSVGAAPIPIVSEEPDLFAGIIVTPLAPPPVTTATPVPAPAPAPVVVSKPGAKEALPNPTTLTAQNLCLAVWCAEVGGSTASFNVYWDGIKKDKKLFQAYDNYAKTLKKSAVKRIPEVRAIRDTVGPDPAVDTLASASGSSVGQEGSGMV